MENLFIKLLNMSVAAGWVILAILLLRLLLKKAPKAVRCCLWILAGIRLLCPISLESALSLIPSAEPVPREILYEARPAIESGIAPVDNAINPILASSLAPNPGDSVNPMQIIIYLAARLWLAGMILMLAYGLISAFRLRRRIGASIRLEDNVFLCDNISSPFIFGILFPRIYLPSALHEPQLAFVIAHEKAHLRRHDHWWKPLGFLLLSVYWFHPLCWWAYILLCRDIELACDEHVVRSMGKEEKRGYAETLLSWGVSRPVISACPLAFGEVSVKKRVKTVLNYRKPSFWIVLAGILACTAAAVCLLTSPASTPRDIFGAKYQVTEILYDAPWYDFTYTVDSAPEYVFTADLELMERCLDGSPGNAAWTLLGGFGPVDYSQDKLHSLFEQPSGSPEGQILSDTARKELNRVKKIWRANTFAENKLFYLAMQTQEGDVLLAVGYGPEEDSHIRWLWKMESASVGYSQEYLAGLASSMYGSDVTLFSVYESGTMPGKLIAGFQTEEDHSMGFAVFNCGDSQNSYSSTIKGVKSFGKDTLYSFTLGENWGFDHSITLVLSRINNLARVTARSGDTVLDASPGSVTPAMIVLEWPKLLSEEEIDQVELFYSDGASDSLRLFEASDNTQDGLSAGAAESLPEISSQKKASSLEMAISAAIYENCSPDQPDSDGESYDNSMFQCESHRLLAVQGGISQSSGGFTFVEGSASSQEIIAYIMVMYQVYDLSQGDIREISGGYFPAKLTFSVAGSEDYDPGTAPLTPLTQATGYPEGYTLEEFLVPWGAYSEIGSLGSRDAWEDWLQETFPGDIAEEAFEELTSQIYIDMHKQSCYAQAVVYENIDTHSVIEQLFAAIQSAPCSESSNPYSYLTACPVEHWKLRYYGKYTLQYISSEFQKGEQTGLKGQLMKIIQESLSQAPPEEDSFKVIMP